MKTSEEKTAGAEAVLADEALTQLNTRVPNKMKRVIKASLKTASIDMEVAAVDAWKLYFGINDSMLESRRSLAKQAFRKVTKGTKRPFEQPLAPSKNNARLTIRLSSATVPTSAETVMGS